MFFFSNKLSSQGLNMVVVKPKKVIRTFYLLIILWFMIDEKRSWLYAHSHTFYKDLCVNWFSLILLYAIRS